MARPAKKADTNNVDDVVEYLKKHRDKVLDEATDKTKHLSDEEDDTWNRFALIERKINKLRAIPYSWLPSDSRALDKYIEDGLTKNLMRTTYDVAEVNEVLDSMGPKFRAKLWNNLRQKRKAESDEFSSRAPRQITITAEALAQLGIAKKDLGVSSYSEAIIKLQESYTAHKHQAE